MLTWCLRSAQFCWVWKHIPVKIVWNQRTSQPKANPTQEKIAKDGRNGTCTHLFSWISAGWVVALAYDGDRWFSYNICHMFNSSFRPKYIIWQIENTITKPCITYTSYASRNGTGGPEEVCTLTKTGFENKSTHGTGRSDRSWSRSSSGQIDQIDHDLVHLVDR